MSTLCRSRRNLFLACLSASITLSPVAPARALEATITDADDFSKQYTALTKKILLRSIELERFSLNYRTESQRQPKLRRLRYFAAQEAAAGCTLGFEVVGDREFNAGRHRALDVNTNNLSHGITTVMTGSIIGASSSAFELSANFMQSIKNNRKGLSNRDADKFVSTKLNELDSLIAERSALVSAHSSDPAYSRAVAEGKILEHMRSAFINEYATFNTDTNKFLTYQNTFFFLNSAYNTVGAVAAGVSKRALTHPKLNGPANIMFIVTGAIAGATPLITLAASKVAERAAHNRLERVLAGHPKFDPGAFEAACNEMKSASGNGEATLIPTLPSTERIVLYTQTDSLFQKQLESETRNMRFLNRIALSTSAMGPVIGSLLMTQGILGTYGYYQYGTGVPRLRKEFNQFYHGAVVGTVGASMNVVGNAAWFLGSMAYEHKLRKEQRLPEQLIAQRLNRLDDLEKLVSAL